MAHFAKISEENIVLQVLTLNNSDMLDSNNIENESIGQEYLEKHNNWPRHLWIQTSYNTINNQHRFNGNPFRGNFAGIGYTWDEQNQIFWPPKPYPSWSKNIQIGTWESPIGQRPEETQEMINNKQYYIWNENSTSWDIYSRPVQI
jgi:hypothetical protein